MVVEGDKVIPWPNKRDVVDGVVPLDEVPQDPNIFDDEDLDIEMSD